MRKKSVTFCAAIAFTAPCVLVAAEDVSLKEMVVSSEAIEAVKELPTTSSGVSAQKLKENTNLVNIEDALKYLPSAMARKRFIGDRNALITTRTSGTNYSARSLLYADGIALSNSVGNSSSYPPRWAMVTPEETQRVDVVYGPFLAELPGNSVGTTVLITTKIPDKFEATVDTQFFYQDYSDYKTKQSFSGSQTEVTAGGKNGKFGIFINANHLDSYGQPTSFASATVASGVASAAGTPVTGYVKDKNQFGADRIVFGATSMDHTVQDTSKLKLTYDITPTSKLSYLVGFWQNDSKVTVDSYLKDAAGNSVYNGNVNIEGRRYSADSLFKPSNRIEQNLLNALSYKTTTGKEWDIEATASIYNYQKDEQRTPNISKTTASTDGAGTIAVGDGTGWQNFDIKADYRPSNSAHKIRFGYRYDNNILNYRTYDTASWISGSPANVSGVFEGKTSTDGIFIQDGWSFTDNMKLTLGARYEQWKAYDGYVQSSSANKSYDERKESYISPKLILEYFANDGWTLKASVGKAVRFPTVAELYQQSTTAGTAITNNDPNLKPEKAMSYELSAIKEFKNGSARVSLFREDIADTIYSQTNTTVTPTVTNLQNIDKIQTQGVEAAAQFENAFIDGLDLQGALTYTKSKILENSKRPSTVGNEFVNIPDWRASAVATYRHTKNLSYSLAGRYSGTQHSDIDNLDNNQDVYGGQSKYYSVDTKISYRLPKGFSVSGGIDNINNNKAYTSHPYPQRTFFAKLRYEYK